MTISHISYVQNCNVPNHIVGQAKYGSKVGSNLLFEIFILVFLNY